MRAAAAVTQSSRFTLAVDLTLHSSHRPEPPVEGAGCLYRSAPLTFLFVCRHRDGQRIDVFVPLGRRCSQRIVQPGRREGTISRRQAAAWVVLRRFTQGP